MHAVRELFRLKPELLCPQRGQQHAELLSAAGEVTAMANRRPICLFSSDATGRTIAQRLQHDYSPFFALHVRAKRMDYLKLLLGDTLLDAKRKKNNVITHRPRMDISHCGRTRM